MQSAKERTGKMREEKQAIIRIEHLNKQYIVDKKPVDVLKDISLEIKEGEFVTIVGHSGCGKSTLLRIISGLAEYEDGIVERNGHKVEGPGPQCGNRKRACNIHHILNMPNILNRAECRGNDRLILLFLPH